MAALNVDLTFYRDATTEGMHIDTDADGNLRDDSNLGGPGHPITGTYDETTNALTFSAGGLEGVRGGDLFVSHYSGYAIFDGDGNLFGLAGTYHELVITLEPFGFGEALGGWYAIPNIE
jgi:hypothetical protein